MRTAKRYEFFCPTTMGSCQVRTHWLIPLLKRIKASPALSWGRLYLSPSSCRLFVLVTFSIAALFCRHSIDLLWFGPVGRPLARYGISSRSVGP